MDEIRPITLNVLQMGTLSLIFNLVKQKKRCLLKGELYGTYTIHFHLKRSPFVNRTFNLLLKV